MQIILQEDVDKLGHRGQLVEVAKATLAIIFCPASTPSRRRRAI